MGWGSKLIITLLVLGIVPIVNADAPDWHPKSKHKK